MQPKWLEIAEREIGTKEVAGDADNARIVEYHQCTTLKACDDETPWCSSFVNWCFAAVGITGSRSAAARSWLDWGTVLQAPREGCVVVFTRGKPPSGHVALFISYSDDPAYINCLGGNQSDMVRCSKYPVADVLGYRWPKGQ